MPRGAKKDEPVSRLLFKNGILLDRRSFVSLNGAEPHLYLKGADMSRQRERLVLRDKGKCRKCKRFLGAEAGEAHHVISRGRGGSDDLENLEYRCGRYVGDCHTGEHVQVRWTPRAPQGEEGMEA
jgi:HNH endonuclease